MPEYTNTGLVKHAEAALKLKTKYMWGGILRLITADYIKQLKSMYKTNAGTGYTAARWAELSALIGKSYYGVDCIGLIKSYYWSGNTDGGTGSKYYDPNTDCNAVTMYNRAKVKGKIKDIPETAGLIVYDYRSHHVGIYVGKGYTIESTLGTRGDGVVKRKLDSLWTDYFECPYIKYEKNKPVLLAFDATVRNKPSAKGVKLGLLTAGTKCVIIEGTETKDSVTGYTYVQLAGGKQQWIVKSAIKQ